MTATTAAAGTSVTPDAVRLSGLSVTYPGPSGGEVLRDVTIDVPPRQVVSIVGKSGVGKSTLIRCIAGLQPATSGSVTVLGALVTEPPTTLALVSQDYSRTLMPWLRVAENVRLPLRGHHIPRAEQQERVAQALEAVDLVGVERAYPWQLSGGMQQRVALARALAYQPQVLLMDEPFASVDAQTRADLEDLVLVLQRDLHITVLLVTHDVDEAVYLSDQVVVLGGRPASVHDLVEVPLGADRDQLTTKAAQTFLECRGQVLSAIIGQTPGPLTPSG